MPIDRTFKTIIATCFKNRSSSGKFEKKQVRSRGNINKLQKGYHIWRNTNSSMIIEKDNDEFERATLTDFTINTRAKTVSQQLRRHRHFLLL